MGNGFVVHKSQKNFEQAVARLDRDDAVCAENKVVLLAFSKMRLAKGTSKLRVVKCLYCLRYLAKWLKKPFIDATKDDLIEVVSEDEYPQEKYPVVEQGQSMLPPGLSSFHAFRVDLSGLNVDSPQSYLENALKHVLVRNTVRPLLRLQKEFRQMIANKARGQLYWLRSSPHKDVLSLYFPHQSFHFQDEAAAKLPEGQRLQRDAEHLEKMLGEHGFFERVFHAPAHAKPTFHVFNVRLKSGFVGCSKKQLNARLAQLASKLKQTR